MAKFARFVGNEVVGRYGPVCHVTDITEETWVTKDLHCVLTSLVRTPSSPFAFQLWAVILPTPSVRFFSLDSEAIRFL